MSEYTPGPWRFDPQDEGRIYTASQDHPACHAFDIYNDNWQANARLIAAAPELLETLLNLGEAVEEGCPETIANIWCYQAQRVISKAGGDKPS